MFSKPKIYKCAECGAHDHFDDGKTAESAGWRCSALGLKWYCRSCEKTSKTKPKCPGLKSYSCSYGEIHKIEKLEAYLADMKKQRDDFEAVMNYQVTELEEHAENYGLLQDAFDKEKRMRCLSADENQRLSGELGQTRELRIQETQESDDTIHLLSRECKRKNEEIMKLTTELSNRKAENRGLRHTLKLHSIAVGADGSSVREVTESFDNWQRHNTPVGSTNHLISTIVSDKGRTTQEFKDYEFAMGLLRRCQGVEVF